MLQGFVPDGETLRASAYINLASSTQALHAAGCACTCCSAGTLSKQLQLSAHLLLNSCRHHVSVTHSRLNHLSQP
jgi:hypothetical protein